MIPASAVATASVSPAQFAPQRFKRRPKLGRDLAPAAHTAHARADRDITEASTPCEGGAQYRVTAFAAHALRELLECDGALRPVQHPIDGRVFGSPGAGDSIKGGRFQTEKIRLKHGFENQAGTIGGFRQSLVGELARSSWLFLRLIATRVDLPFCR